MVNLMRFKVCVGVRGYGGTGGVGGGGGGGGGGERGDTLLYKKLLQTRLPNF